MTLGEQQRVFVKLIGKLIEAVYNAGYELTWGEAWRPPETAELYSKQGKGIKNSLHCDRLAVDLNLFKDGQYLTGAAGWEQFGKFWESLDPRCCWGGRFKDPNHFSMAWGGRK